MGRAEVRLQQLTVAIRRGDVAAHGYNPYRYESDAGVIVPFHGVTTNAFYLLDEHLRGFCNNASLGSA